MALVFLISLPTISYYEAGTMLTPAHGHAAMVGLVMVVLLSLFPGGLLQLWDVAFIVFGAAPLVIASTKAYLGICQQRA